MKGENHNCSGSIAALPPATQLGATTGNRSALIATLVVLALPILYVLGVGPVQFAEDHDWISRRHAEAAYSPLASLFRVAPRLQPPVDAYVGLWSEVMPPYNSYAMSFEFLENLTKPCFETFDPRESTAVIGESSQRELAKPGGTFSATTCPLVPSP